MMRTLFASLVLTNALVVGVSAGFAGASARQLPTERDSNCATQMQECTVDGQQTPYPPEGGGNH